jgi:hypothetical protein
MVMVVLVREPLSLDQHTVLDSLLHQLIHLVMVILQVVVVTHLPLWVVVVQLEELLVVLLTLILAEAAAAEEVTFQAELEVLVPFIFAMKSIHPSNHKYSKD